MHHTSLLVVAIFGLVLIAVSSSTTVLASSSRNSTSSSSSSKCYEMGITTMLSFHDWIDSYFSGTGWWNSACIYTELVLAAGLELKGVPSSTLESFSLLQTLQQKGRNNSSRSGSSSSKTHFRPKTRAVSQKYPLTSKLLDMLESAHLSFTIDFDADVAVDRISLDDVQWWALAFTFAHDLVLAAGARGVIASNSTAADVAKKYLASAEKVHAVLVKYGWTETPCGGGTWWSSRHTYKNAITNELFLQVSAALARRTPVGKTRSFYLAWALKEHDWFVKSGMINNASMINDGLSTPACTNNHGTTWTYNQGVVLAGLGDLFTLTGKIEPYLREAIMLAYASMNNAATTRSTPNGRIMKEPCEPSCGNDGCQFKGIYMRSLNLLRISMNTSSHALPREISHFANEVLPAAIRRNAESLCTADTKKSAGKNGMEFGLMWTGPFDKSDACRQGSGLGAMVALKSLEVNYFS